MKNEKLKVVVTIITNPMDIKGKTELNVSIELIDAEKTNLATQQPQVNETLHESSTIFNNEGSDMDYIADSAKKLLKVL
jgi:hypothetical protein